MGMYLELLAASDATIARLEADPPLAWRLLAPDEPEREAAARAETEPSPSFLSRLFGRGTARSPQATPPDLALADDEGDLGPLGNFEKSWHGLHYLLTGTAWEGEPPLNFLLAGGREIDIGLGLSPVRAHTSAGTRAIASALAAVTTDELRVKLDASEMMRLEIYPEVWDREGELDRLLEDVEHLREALAAVLARGHGLLVAIQ